MSKPPAPSGNLFYDNKDLDGLPADLRLASAPIVKMLRDYRDVEAVGGRRCLWMGHRWMDKGIPVTIQNCKITKTGKNTFTIEATGVAASEKTVPQLKGQVIILPSQLRRLDEEIVNGVAPFFACRGAVEALEMALGLDPHGDMKKYDRYLITLRQESEEVKMCPNCCHPKNLKSPQDLEPDL